MESAARTPVTADELPGLSVRLSARGKRTELVRGDRYPRDLLAAE